MSSARKRLSRLNQRISHAYSRQAALHAVIDVFNYAGAHVSVPTSSSLSTITSTPSASSSLLLSTSPLPPAVSTDNKSCISSSSSLSSLSDYSDNEDNVSLCSIDGEIFNSINIESSENIFTNFSIDSDFENPATSFSSKEISVLLIELRCRHSLTKSCMTHICQLLQLLQVPNAPLSFDSVESQVLCAYQSITFPTQSIVCPSCYQKSSNLKRCTNTHGCASQHSFIRSPTINYTFALEPQVRSILEKNQIVFPKLNHDSISDITNGQVYKKLLRKEKTPFVTLLMNSDGGLIKIISKSIWLTSFVLNELPRAVRFLPENTILGMISTGSMKPKKDEMSSIMQDLVNELHHLENGISILFPSVESNNSEQIVNIYLLGCVCDKPATSLLLNHTECTGFFGCTYCTIKGNFIQKAKMLKLLLSKPSGTAGISDAMTVYNKIDHIAEIINSISYPSTTYRQPRDIRLFRKFKGNEFRIILLFGYSVFEGFLDQERYAHLKALAFIAHIVEAQYLSSDAHKDVEYLASYFDKKFAFLYTDRHVVPVIHSIRHFYSCIRDYGPMFNYSTFSFESTMASFSGTIHGGSAPITELIKNIDLYRQSSICISSSSFPTKGKEYVSRICSSPRQITSNYQDDLANIRLHKKLTSPPSNFFGQWSNLSQSNIFFYKTLFINDLRFSADDFTTIRHSNDAYALADSEFAILLDEQNITGHIQKVKSLFQLSRYEQARAVIQRARDTAGK
ncbi:unnamed protein product [Rotaria sp. Silwood2]|nr:unnamed protein product [Rotaria sp. Silwood2]